MTVANTARTAGPYTGNGAVSIYPFVFKVFLATDVTVQLTSAAGVLSTGTLGTDYSVSLNPDQNNAPGGNVVLTAPLASGAQMTIGSQVPLTQGVVLTNPGGFYPQVVSDALDKLTILIQQGLTSLSGALRIPEIGSSAQILPPAAQRANNLLSFDASGNPVVVAPALGTATALAILLASITGAAQVGYKRTGISTAVASTLQKQADGLELNLVADFNADPTGMTDSTAAVQAFWNATSNGSLFTAPSGFMPAGKYKVSSTINCPAKYNNVRGAGRFQTQILCDTVVGPVFKVAAIQYWSPTWSDFAIIDSTLTTTGSAIDTTALTPYGSAQMYNFEFRNLYLYTKATSFICYSAFSGKFDNVLFNSSAGNSVTVSCGPGVTWINSYASIAGTGKCAWRLCGTIAMYSCNSMDAGDRACVFGQDPTASDGYQNDFPLAGNDYPDVTMIGCNIEHFAVNGITLHNAFRNFRFIGGKLDRNALSTPYESIIKARLGPVANAPLYLSPGYVFIGTGVPNGGVGLTNAWLYAPSGQPIFVDENGILGTAGVSGFYSAAYAGLVPLATQQAINDVPQGAATQFNAIRTVRASVGIVRYNSGGVIAPVGTNQTVDVTSRERVVITPAAAATVSVASFDTTPGAGTDQGRNGQLIVEAGNANLTLVHSTSTANGFRLTAGANLAMYSGQAVRFLFSTTANMWIQG